MHARWEYRPPAPDPDLRLYRPASYNAPELCNLANITGTQRRFAASRDLDLFGRIDSDLVRDSTEQERQHLGRLHPQFRSGEDLRSVRHNEVEIARLTLVETVHGEVTSIRARQITNRICYEIESENESEFGITFITKPQSSILPLSLGQLVNLINTVEVRVPWDKNKLDRVGLVIPVWEWERRHSASKTRVRHFIRFASLFYPMLNDWFTQYFDHWAWELGWSQEKGKQ